MRKGNFISKIIKNPNKEQFQANSVVYTRLLDKLHKSAKLTNEIEND